MLKYFIYIPIALMAFGCSTASKVAVSDGNKTAADSVEYELVVLDPDFNSWFVSHQKPVWYYSGNFYKYWNTIFVNEWNHRCNNPVVYGMPYDYSIDYEHRNDYGVDLEHELYWYFKFIEEKYNTSLYLSGR
ncbi:MAG: DUF6146 family protein [Bacteroidales bacterium]